MALLRAPYTDALHPWSLLRQPFKASQIVRPTSPVLRWIPSVKATSSNPPLKSGVACAPELYFVRKSSMSDFPLDKDKFFYISRNETRVITVPYFTKCRQKWCLIVSEWGKKPDGAVGSRFVFWKEQRRGDQALEAYKGILPYPPISFKHRGISSKTRWQRVLCQGTMAWFYSQLSA